MIPQAESRARARQWRWAAAAAAVAAVTVAAVAAVTIAGEHGAAKAASTPSGPTTTIQRRDLIQTDDVPGALGFSDTRSAYSMLGGAVTWLPHLGQVISPDHRLFSLGGAPVVLMSGTVPMYRTLATGVADGPDVRELEADLARLGYDPYHEITVDDHYTAATADAVDRWAQAHGLAQDGQVALGRIVFLPGRRRVSSLGASLGQVLPPNAPGAVVTTTADRQLATVQLDANKQTEAVVGERVNITLPTERVVGGVITRVGRVAQVAGQPGGQNDTGGNSTGGPGAAPTATIPVTIALRHAGRLPPLDQAPVTVALAQATSRDVLAIPVSALLATAGGGYAIDVVGPGGTVTPEHVTPGSFAGGYVQVTGAGIAAGMKIRDTAQP